MNVQDIFDATLAFNGEKVVELVKETISEGGDISALLNDGLIGAMDEVGRKFSAGELFVPEMLMAAHAMKAGLEELRPHLSAGASKPKGTIVIGTVKGDLHDIGKNLVTMMLEGGGFKVVDLGVDVDVEKFLEGAAANNADIIGISALLTTTMPAMEATVSAIRERAGYYKTMVGGAPITQEFADQIGANGFSESAPGAVETARELLAG